ncbi:unnamed protein product [Sphagnum balticum]
MNCFEEDDFDLFDTEEVETDERIHDLQTHIDFLDQKMIGLQQENSDLRDEVNQLKRDVEFHKAIAYDALDRAKQLMTKVVEKDNQINHLKSDIEFNVVVGNFLMDQWTESLNQLEKKDNQIKQLNQRIIELEEKINVQKDK